MRKGLQEQARGGRDQEEDRPLEMKGTLRPAWHVEPKDNLLIEVREPLGDWCDEAIRFFLLAGSLITIVAANAVPLGAALSNEPLVGRASVVDGDTIEIQGQRVRFDGIDAPESRQTCTDEKGEDYPCGQIAAFALDDFLAASRPTRCELTGDRSWRRWGSAPVTRQMGSTSRRGW